MSDAGNWRYVVTLMQDATAVTEIMVSRRHRDLLQVAIPTLGVWELEGMTGETALPILEAAFVEVTTPEHAAAYSWYGGPDALANVAALVAGVMVRAGHHPRAIFRVR